MLGSTPESGNVWMSGESLASLAMAEREDTVDDWPHIITAHTSVAA
ncbi:hypothetical protein [Erwinia phage Pecta]|nr:hypothetical protein [Erwinia phage Pecta]